MHTTATAHQLISQQLPKKWLMGNPVQGCLVSAVPADRPLPPFPRSTMDGIAIQTAYTQGLVTGWSLQGTQWPGQPPLQLRTSRNAIEIMTGAPLPQGCDAVVPYEKIKIHNGHAHLTEDHKVLPKPGSAVHPLASDCQQGEALLSGGTKVHAAAAALLAAVGADPNHLQSMGPRITLVTTGDEVVAPHSPVETHQIRNSNLAALEWALKRNGLQPSYSCHWPDQPELVEAQLERLLPDCDVLILSGGVSQGRKDLLPQLLEKKAVKPIFHKVSQRPGKPLWFGVGPSGQLVFGLPGNPVSTLVCLMVYVIPHLLSASGITTKRRWAQLDQPVEWNAPLDLFTPVKLSHHESGVTKATPLPLSNSGNLVRVAHSDGFLHLPQQRHPFHSGQCYRLYPWGNFT